MGGKDKSSYFEKLRALLEEYKSVFIVEIDNVSSQQMHEIRHSLRNQAVVLMGKNTMVRFKKSSIHGQSRLTRTGSSCPQDLPGRPPRVRAFPPSRPWQHRFRLHQLRPQGHP